MSGKVTQTQNGQHASSSLAAWQEFSVREIQLTEQLSVKVTSLDVLSWLSRDEDNPLLSIVVQSAQEGTTAEEAGDQARSDAERMAKLTKKLDELMIEVMVSPPLKEQGVDEGIPVSRITIGQKMKIFYELFDEEQLAQLGNFRAGPGGRLQPGPKSQTVRKNTK